MLASNQVGSLVEGSHEMAQSHNAIRQGLNIAAFDNSSRVMHPNVNGISSGMGGIGNSDNNGVIFVDTTAVLNPSSSPSSPPNLSHLEDIASMEKALIDKLVPGPNNSVASIGRLHSTQAQQDSFSLGTSAASLIEPKVFSNSSSSSKGEAITNPGNSTKHHQYNINLPEVSYSMAFSSSNENNPSEYQNNKSPSSSHPTMSSLGPFISSLSSSFSSKDGSNNVDNSAIGTMEDVGQAISLTRSSYPGLYMPTTTATSSPGLLSSTHQQNESPTSDDFAITPSSSGTHVAPLSAGALEVRYLL